MGSSTKLTIVTTPRLAKVAEQVARLQRAAATGDRRAEKTLRFAERYGVRPTQDRCARMEPDG